MFEQLSARARAAMRHGAEGAERLRGEWLNAGREAYGGAIRNGRDVVARTESELEVLGRKAMAEKARLKAVVRKGADDAGRGVEAGRVRLDQAIGKAQQGLRGGVNAVAEGAQHAGRATVRTLDGMGGQVMASQPVEREIVGAMGPRPGTWSARPGTRRTRWSDWRMAARDIWPAWLWEPSPM